MPWELIAEPTDEPSPVLTFEPGDRVLIITSFDDRERTVVRRGSDLYLRPDDDPLDPEDEPDPIFDDPLELYRDALLLLHPPRRPLSDDLMGLVHRRLAGEARIRQRYWLLRRMLAGRASPLDRSAVIEEMDHAFEEIGRELLARRDQLRTTLPRESPTDRHAWWREHERDWRPDFMRIVDPLRDALRSEFFSSWEWARLADERGEFSNRLEDAAVAELHSWREGTPELTPHQIGILDRWFKPNSG